METEGIVVSVTLTSVQNGNEKDNDGFSIKVYNNHDNDNTVNLLIQSPDLCRAKVTLADINGKFVGVLLEDDISTGENEFTIPISNLNNGIYILIARCGIHMAFTKIQIVR